MDKVLSIYYQNCRGIRTKLHTLYMNVLLYDYDAILLTETFLTADIFDNEFIDSRYHVYRCDRNRAACGRRDGGGVLIAVRRSLAATPLVPTSESASAPPPAIVDYVLVELLTAKGRHVIGVTYIPPNLSYDIYQSYFNYLHEIIPNTSNCNIHLAGDYNLPTIKWTRNSDTFLEPLITNTQCSTSQHLCDFMSAINLTQFNNIENYNGHILDLFLSTEKECTISCVPSTLVPPDGHHPPFYVLLPFTKKSYVPLIKQTRYCFKNTDYTTINKEILSIDWVQIFQNKPANCAVDLFYEMIYGYIRQHITSKTIKGKKFPSWFNSSLIKIFKDKKKSWNKWKKYNNISDYEIFCVLRTRFKRVARNRYNEYMNLVEDNIKSNVQYFWQYISNRKNGAGVHIPSNLFYKTNTANSPTEVCNLFSNYFHSVFVPSDLTEDFNINNAELIGDNAIAHDVISNVNITVENVHKALLKLDVSKGPGLDDIPPIFFKSTAVTICKPLHILYIMCLQQGIFPNKWKLARIVPVYKSGSKRNVENYRPISILPVLSKLFERLIHDAIYPLLHKTIITQQHGFVQKRSTITNLLVFTSQLFENLDNNKQTDSIYTDFQKAFDKVDHKLLLEKLAYNGIRGNLWRWFKSYITNRMQKVVINGHSSEVVMITSGVPQGSILGPLLFILFINDIHKCFKHSSFLLYADDLKIYTKIDTPDDHNHLQSDLNRFSDYCTVNKLNLSLNKCKCITYTKKNNISNFKYTLCGISLEKVDVIRDLGVTLDCKLHLDTHVQSITNKAFKMYGFVMRASNNFKRATTYIHLYKSLVRSQLEYAVAIWNPHYKKYVDKIETVQKKFLKSMHYKCTRSRLHYDQLLERYQLLDLNSRRKHLESMLLYDLCHNKYDCIPLTRKLCYRVPFKTPTRSCRTHQLFSTAKCRTNAGKRSPVYRMTQSYNNHFGDIDIFSTRVGTFKKLVIRHLKSIM